MNYITNIIICLSIALTTNILSVDLVNAQTTDQGITERQNTEILSYEELENLNAEAFDEDTIYTEEN